MNETLFENAAVLTEPVTTNETVTPATAAKYLERNQYNYRRASKDRIQQYARAIELGQWRLNGESIKFDTDGNLMDGQHRLRAIVQANRPVRMTITRGVECDNHIDTGKPRSMTDLLRRHKIANSYVVAATSTFYFRLQDAMDCGEWPNKWIRNVSEDLAFVLANDTELQTCIHLARPACAPFTLSRLAACLFAFRQLDPVDANEFARLLNTSNIIDPDCPHYKLRSAIQRLKASSRARLSASYEIGLIIKTWNFARLGASVKTLNYRTFGQGREKFPVAV